MKPDVKPELGQLIKAISTKSMYYGNRIPDSVMRMFEIVEDEFHAGIKVPYWLPVLQTGRPPRRSTKDSGLWKKIYRWMERRNMFRTDSPAGRMREAKFVTLWINRHGNVHFRSKVFIDIYTTERKKTVEAIYAKFGKTISEITMQVI